MHHMVMLVLDDIKFCPDILSAWEEAGVTGITVIESTGLGRVRKMAALRDDLPLMPNLISLLQSREERHRTILTVVDSEALVDRLIELTDGIVGGLDAPNKGVLFVLPVSRIVGARSTRAE